MSTLPDIEVDFVDFKCSWTEKRNFVLARNPSGVLAMIPIPIDKDQDLYSLEPLYNIGMEATKNWYRKSFAESNLTRTFDGFLVAEAEHMDRWLMKPENQTALKQAIHEYFTLTNNKCLKYNGNREWSTVPY